MSNLIDLDSSAKNSQIVKDIVVGAMILEGFISNDEGKRFLENYAVITVKKGWLSSMIDKFFTMTENKDDFYYRVVKVIHPTVNEEK